MSDIEALRGEVAHVKTEVDGIKGEVHSVRTDVEVVKQAVVELKSNERDAKEARGAIHNKLDDIKGAIDERTGAEGVRKTLRQWAWDAAKVLAGAVVAWLVKVFTGW
jgi:uncharacterized protein (UPF0335 family)